MKLFAVVVLLISSQAWATGSIDNGAKLFKKCISCHGSNGMGKKSQNAPMIAGQYDWYIVTQVSAIQSKKRQNKNTKKMFPFVKKLSKQDIEDLAAYISAMELKK